MKNDNLYTELINFKDENGLPVCDSIQFKRLTDTYTKEVFRETLSEYIATEKPKFPLRTITKEKVRERNKRLIIGRELPLGSHKTM